MIPEAIRNAVALVKANPAAISEIDAEEAAKVAAAKLEAERIAKLEAKVAKSLDDRAAALVDDYYATERAAIERAAARLAESQLRQEVGLTPPAVTARTPAHARLSPAHVERELRAILGSAALPWDKAGRSGTSWRTDAAKDAAAALPSAPYVLQTEQARDAGTYGLTPAEAEELAEKRRTQMEAQRAAAIDARKRVAKAGPS